MTDYFSEGIKGELGKTGNNFSIMVNKKDCLDEQVKTILHELVHLGLEGPNLNEYSTDINEIIIRGITLGNVSEEQKDKIKKFENEIEKLVQDFYNRNASLVEHIRKKLYGGQNYFDL